MTVWSLTPFFQETEVLDWRLRELETVVDRHVFVEATVDHRGNSHEPCFPEHLKQRDDIEYRLVDLNTPTSWGREKKQRDLLATPEIAPDDVVLLSDLDEIPSARAVQGAAQNASERPEVLQLAMHVYRPRWRWTTLSWTYQICRVFKGSLLQRKSLQQIRMLNGQDVLCTGEFPGLGWHMAFMGGPKMIRAKLAAFAHDELSGAGDRAERAYRNGDDLFGRDIQVEQTPLKAMPDWWQA